MNGGNIVFLPAAGEGRKGAAEVVDGKFAIPLQQGLLPGKYRVEIHWPKATGRQIPSGDPGMTMEERLEVVPRKYNAESVLVAEITDKENKLDFELTR